MNIHLVRIGTLFVVEDFLISIHSSGVYLIELNQNIVLKKISIKPEIVKINNQKLVIYDGRFWIGECLDLQASFELNLIENPNEAGNLFLSLNTWENALKLMAKNHKYNDSVDY